MTVTRVISNEPPAQTSFFRELFHRHTKIHHIPEPDYGHDIRVALFALRRITGMTQEQVALRAGMGVSNLNLLELRGSPVTRDQCARLKATALTFCLPKMAELFDMEMIKAKDPKKRRERGDELGEGTWRDGG